MSSVSEIPLRKWKAYDLKVMRLALRIAKDRRNDAEYEIRDSVVCERCDADLDAGEPHATDCQGSEVEYDYV